MSPRAVVRAHQASRWRRLGESTLANLLARAEARFKAAILVDGMWDNPNYWIRYALFRAAVGSAAGREIGVLGTHRAAEGQRTLKQFGISRALQVRGLRGDMASHRREARRLLAPTAT